jgi:hypothetical protein
MTNTCHLKEPSIPFATVTGATLTLDDGTTLPDAANASIGMKSVDFEAIYTVDAPLA